MTGLAALIGIGYVTGGTDPARDGGVDCYGAVRLALRLFGVELPETPEEALASADALAFELGPAQATEPGDLLEFVGDEEGRTHVGVAVDAFRIFHATRKLGTVITAIDPYSGRLRRRLRFRRAL